MQPADYLVHFSNILLLVSYSVRDILWLRWFAVAAALTNIPYFLVQDTVLWPPVLWASVFTAINLFQIARIYMERRPVVLSTDEQTLYDLAVTALRERQLVVELDEDKLGRLETWTPSPAAAPLSMDLSVFVVAASAADVDKGNFQVVVGPNLGATAAGRSQPGRAVGCGPSLSTSPGSSATPTLLFARTPGLTRSPSALLPDARLIGSSPLAS